MEPTTCTSCRDQATTLVNLVRNFPKLHACYEKLRTTASVDSATIDLTTETTASIFTQMNVDASGSPTSTISLELSYTTIVGRHGHEIVHGHTASKVYSMRLLIELSTGSPEHMSDADLMFASSWHTHRIGRGPSLYPIFSTLASDHCESCTALAQTILSRPWRLNSESCLLWTNSDGSFTVGDDRSRITISYTDIRRVGRAAAVFDAFLEKLLYTSFDITRSFGYQKKRPYHPSNSH